jgi:hypothetical protein
MVRDGLDHGYARVQTVGRELLLPCHDSREQGCAFGRVKDRVVPLGAQQYTVNVGDDGGLVALLLLQVGRQLVGLGLVLGSFPGGGSLLGRHAIRLGFLDGGTSGSGLLGLLALIRFEQGRPPGGFLGRQLGFRPR